MGAEHQPGKSHEFWTRDGGKSQRIVPENSLSFWTSSKGQGLDVKSMTMLRKSSSPRTQDQARGRAVAFVQMAKDNPSRAEPLLRAARNMKGLAKIKDRVELDKASAIASTDAALAKAQASARRKD